MAYYLKYRPQTILELDLEKVRNSLGELLKAKDTPHAFLFVGPKGTGKTSSARIVAKAVNCLKPKAGEPCNKCEACKLIIEGRSLDIIEIDAASNRGIDDIRELREKIKLVPSVLKFKIYIIDEVHMLTIEAFNALLKTLEEPPKHAKFILCTTEPHKIPGTIVSRCVKVEFSKGKVSEIVRSLKRIVKGENLKILDNDLVLIAKNSGGSFRDGVKVLEQLSFGGKKITSKKVKEFFLGGASEVLIDDFLGMVYRKEIKKALGWLAKVINGGMNVRQLGVDIVERLREVLMIKLRVEEGEDIEEIDDINKLKELIDLFHRAAREIKGSVIESLSLELAVVKWGNQTERIKVIEMPKATEEKVSELKTPELKVRSGKVSLDSVIAKWGEVMAAMKPHNHSIEALLRSTKPSGFDGEFLVLEVFYQFHKERLEADRYRQIIEQVVSEVLSQPTRVRFLLGDKAKNITAEVTDDIVTTAEEVFGVEVN
ncbi:MAG: DNA polymerase III subunit gamma/tau [Candidatus Beckwithbacteria bacterium]|nr:DNA polymerase III subunit gamma/tau [Patescibacteria group bacterium]